MDKTPKQYVEEYYQNYATGEIDSEVEATGTFLIENVRGKVLDCGCGPVPQLWVIFMPNMDELHAIDLPIESIVFSKNKIDHINDWYKNFEEYKKIVEKNVGVLTEDYIAKQVSKIKSVQQADMTKKLPFSKNYFNTIISLYSLGCLNDELELKDAIENIKDALVPGGVFLHINTNGENKNDILPAYTWNGISQASSLIEKFLKEEGFTDISKKSVKLDSEDRGMYRYNELSLLRAVKSLKSL